MTIVATRPFADPQAIACCRTRIRIEKIDRPFIYELKGIRPNSVPASSLSAAGFGCTRAGHSCASRMPGQRSSPDRCVDRQVVTAGPFSRLGTARGQPCLSDLFTQFIEFVQLNDEIRGCVGVSVNALSEQTHSQASLTKKCDALLDDGFLQRAIAYVNRAEKNIRHGVSSSCRRPSNVSSNGSLGMFIAAAAALSDTDVLAQFRSVAAVLANAIAFWL